MIEIDAAKYVIIYYNNIVQRFNKLTFKKKDKSYSKDYTSSWHNDA